MTKHLTTGETIDQKKKEAMTMLVLFTPILPLEVEPTSTSPDEYKGQKNLYI